MTTKASALGNALALLGLLLDLPAALFWLFVLVILLVKPSLFLGVGFGFEAPSPELAPLIFFVLLPALALLFGLEGARRGGGKVLAWSVIGLSSLLLLLSLAASVAMRILGISP